MKLLKDQVLPRNQILFNSCHITKVKRSYIGEISTWIGDRLGKQHNVAFRFPFFLSKNVFFSKLHLILFDCSVILLRKRIRVHVVVRMHTLGNCNLVSRILREREKQCKMPSLKHVMNVTTSNQRLKVRSHQK